MSDFTQAMQNQAMSQTLSLPCPACRHTIECERDGEIVTCPACGAVGEVHNDKALDLNTNREFSVRLIEPVEATVKEN